MPRSPVSEMYILNLGRAYRENARENTWREMFLCFTVGMKLILRRKKFKKKNTVLGENVAITPNSYRPLKDF